MRYKESIQTKLERVINSLNTIRHLSSTNNITEAREKIEETKEIIEGALTLLQNETQD